MKNSLMFVLILVQSCALAGCDTSGSQVTDKNATSTTGTSQSAGQFRKNYEQADRFLELKHQGDAYRKSGKYKMAIGAYTEALEKYALIRPVQAVALDHIAQTYEEMHDLKNAADNYEYASIATMNEDRQKSLKAKADTLRQKLAARPSV